MLTRLWGGLVERTPSLPSRVKAAHGADSS